MWSSAIPRPERAAAALALLLAGAACAAPKGDRASEDDGSDVNMGEADGGPADGGADGGAADGGADGADTGASTPPLPWTDDACAGVDVGDDPFADTVARVAALDDAAPPPAGGLVVAGSSSVRRWRGMARALSAFDPLQRGVGGARAADIARYAPELILRHRPAGLLLFAGTNDLADGRPRAQVLDDLRCVAQQLHESVPGAPILFIGVTPTPARWAGWAEAAALNADLAALADLHPSLVYVDVPSAFLARGSPPDPGLFVDDGLHLSAEGYALWESVVVPAVAAALPPSALPLPAGPPAGAYLRLDLGPSNPEDGAPAPDPDGFGIRWNRWHPTTGGAQVHAGEGLRGLQTTTGLGTEVAAVLSGGFRSNGYRNGGLTSPPGDLLGTLAVPEATGDFFYSGDPDDPAGITLSGLDPTARHTLRLFASRADASEVRRTAFTVFGGGAPASIDLTTTGAGVGARGYDGNNAEVAVLTGLVPDPRGRLHLELDRAEGAFLYLNLLELEVEAP